MMRWSTLPVALGLVAGTALSISIGCAREETDSGERNDAPATDAAARAASSRSWETPPGFDPLPIPADNAMTAEKVTLGEQLYYDTRLSGDGSRSCYGCHVCEKGLTDGLPTAIGAFEKRLTRSSPTLWNIGFHSEFYWDGRAGSLEAQALAAWKGGNMGADADSVVAVLREIDGYQRQFRAVFGTDVSADGVTKALAAYMRTIICANTPFDRWQAGDEDAVGERARRGYALFTGKAGCATCHSGPLFTDRLYHNVGIGLDADAPDLGRHKVSGNDADRGAFKTPTLRDITRTAPYFHDGSVASLAEVVQIMAGGGKPNPHIDPELKKVELSSTEFSDLLSFLGTLECDCDPAQPPLP